MSSVGGAYKIRLLDEHWYILRPQLYNDSFFIMGFSFRPPWWGIVLLLIGVSLFVRLGMWQWQRSIDKEQLLLRSKQAYYSFLALSKAVKITQYQRLKVSGEFDSARTFLLDNRFYKHRIGFEVINLLKTRNGRYLLVDRGWVQAMANRQQLPSVPLVAVQHELKGQAYYPSSKSWVLSSDLDNVGKWPLIIEKVDIQQIEKLLNVRLYPFMLRLDASDPNALVRDWRVVTMKPAQHKGYAVQWFGFALAAIIIFLVLNVERKGNASR